MPRKYRAFIGFGDESWESTRRAVWGCPADECMPFAKGVYTCDHFQIEPVLDTLLI